MARPQETAQASIRHSRETTKPAADPIRLLAGKVSQSLVEAGFDVHHYLECYPMNPLGGVCLLAVPASPGEHPAGVVVAWTTHDLLALDQSRVATASMVVRGHE